MNPLPDFKPGPLPEFMKDPKVRIALMVVAVLLGIGLGAFLVFQVLFLYKVLPHGGIW